MQDETYWHCNVSNFIGLEGCHSFQCFSSGFDVEANGSLTWIEEEEEEEEEEGLVMADTGGHKLPRDNGHPHFLEHERQAYCFSGIYNEFLTSSIIM